MSFKDWCALDVEDTKKINYTLSGVMEGKKQSLFFTSDEKQDGLMLFRVQNSFINCIDLISNEWYISLTY